LKRPNNHKAKHVFGLKPSNKEQGGQGGKAANMASTISQNARGLMNRPIIKTSTQTRPRKTELQEHILTALAQCHPYCLINKPQR